MSIHWVTGNETQTLDTAERQPPAQYYWKLEVTKGSYTFRYINKLSTFLDMYHIIAYASHDSPDYKSKAYAF